MVGWIKRFFRRRDPWVASVVRVSRPLSTIHEFAFHTCACLNGSPSWFGGKTWIFFLGITCACENESPLHGCQKIVSTYSAQGPSSESCDSFDSALRGRTGCLHGEYPMRRVEEDFIRHGFRGLTCQCAPRVPSQCGSCDSQLSGIRLGSDDGAERHRCDQAC